MRLLAATLGIVAAFLPIAIGGALAQSPPPVLCLGLPGCTGMTVNPTNVLLAFAIPEGVRLLANIAAGGAIIFIMVGGAQMILAMGDEGKITNAKWAVSYALGGLAVALVSQTIVAFVATEEYGQSAPGGDLVLTVLPQVVRIMLILVNVTFTVVIMFAGIFMITAVGSKERYQKGLTIIKWAIIGAIIMNVARAMVEALVNVGF